MVGLFSIFLPLITCDAVKWNKAKEELRIYLKVSTTTVKCCFPLAVVSWRCGACKTTKERKGLCAIAMKKKYVILIYFCPP